MKKLLSIVLAFCMLFTMVSAANTITQDGDPVLNTSERTVTVKFAGIPGTEQATMLAYEIKDAMITEATPIPAYQNETLTPIKGIDQATVSSITTTTGDVSVTSFTFKVAADYVGKMVVKVGGTDAAPIAMIVEFKAAGVTFIWGDVNGDGTVDVTDGTAIINSTGGGQKIFGNYEIGVNVVPTVIWGDVNNDGAVDVTDGTAIINSTGGGQKIFGNYEIGVKVTVR